MCGSKGGTALRGGKGQEIPVGDFNIPTWYIGDSDEIFAGTCRPCVISQRRQKNFHTHLFIMAPSC